MKNLALLLWLLTISAASGQHRFLRDSAVAFQKNLDKEYADENTSPLTKQDRLAFKGLDFFPVDAKYCVTAKFIRTAEEQPFEMKTSTSRRPMYIKYGEAIFSIDGKESRLNIYRSIDLSKTEKYKDYLFLPFLDLTSGNESYGGGRYIDLRIPEGDTIVIDFNRAYNPYCAYNHIYSCPITPRENSVEVEIRAGVKKFHD